MDPWFLIFPAAAAVTFVGLAGGVIRKRSALGGAEGDWAAAMLLCAGGFFGFLLSGATSWNAAADITAGAAGAGASLGLLGAFSGLLQRYTRGRWGTQRVRWTLFAVGLALIALGAGAALGSAGLPGDELPGGWQFVSVIAAIAALFPVLVLTARRSAARATLLDNAQLLGGAGAVAAGLVLASLGETFVGSALGMVGGGILYSGVSTAVPKAPQERTPVFSPRAEPEEPRGAAGPSGRKVMVPKGGAVRVTSFRDDERGEMK